MWWAAAYPSAQGLPSIALVPVAYPATLPPLQRASKSRSQVAAFTIAEPRRGYGYAQAIGTDRPVIWEGQFRFSPADAIRFQLWFTQVARGGLEEFTMPIRTEFGLIEHVCRFLPDGLADATEEAGIYTFKASIMARAQIIPQAFIDAGDLIIGLPDWPLWAEFLDLAIAALPEGAP